MARLLFLFSLFLFGVIGIAALFKDRTPSPPPSPTGTLIEISLNPSSSQPNEPKPVIATITPEEPLSDLNTESFPLGYEGLPNENHIEELFNLGDPQFPFVKTVEYQSRTPWQPSRPAWIADYARHFHTSRHFIARSLNGKVNYLKQDVANGDYFNIFDPEKNLKFHMVIDISRCRMWFYAFDVTSNERFLIKSYDVCLGRKDPYKTSGILTPLGNYTLGDRTAIYTPQVKGFYKGEKTELIRIFGTRWIPFEKALEGATAPARGFGLHGLPWSHTPEGKWVEETESLRSYTSDGCIRFATKDIEEIFAIVTTKPTMITLVKDFHDAKLPGKEVRR